MRVIRMFQAGRRLCSTAAAGTTTVKETVSRLASQFESASVPEPMLSASHLVAHVIKTNNLDDLEQMADDDVEPEQSLKLDAMAKCRLSRMPVQYIVGSWDFRRLTLAMKPPVFIPRPETEQLVSLVLESLKSSEKQRVLEIGSGSGAIALSLLKECGDAEALEVTAVDQSRLACALTMENAILNDVWKGLRVLNARMEEDGVMRMRKKSEKGREDFAKFDLIVSNPPYVLRKDLAALATEIAV
jgi:release factor glutamine methyltransferase